jgi:hypothetical protein
MTFTPPDELIIPTSDIKHDVSVYLVTLWKFSLATGQENHHHTAQKETLSHDLIPTGANSNQSSAILLGEVEVTPKPHYCDHRRISAQKL